MSGEVQGNESVHWHMVHDDRTNGGQPKKTPLRGARGGSISGGDEVEMAAASSEVWGRDGITFDQIGGKRGLVAGSFRVTLRFQTDKYPDLDALKAILRAQVEAMTTVGPQFVLRIDVPAYRRTAAQARGGDPPPEVHVDW